MTPPQKQGQESGDETPVAGELSTVDGQNALRVKVAELLGWRKYDGRTTIPYMWAPGHISSVIPGWYRGNAISMSDFLVDLPDYPSDLNACAELLQSMVADGWDVDIRNNHFNYPWSCLLWKSGKCERGDANELAEAICRAFVAVMESK